MSVQSDVVAQALKSADPDRYFATLVIPAGARAAVQSLYAFNAEIAVVRDRAQDPRAGEIRLRWWADALEGQGHGALRQSPIAAALLDTIEKYRLPPRALLRMIAARRFDLYQDPMPDLESFEGYAGETAGTLLQFAAMILNDGEPVQPGDAAGHLGVAQALIGHLRSFGANASSGRIFLPLPVLTANGVTEQEVFSGTPSEGLAEAVGQLGEIAREHLSKAEAAIAALPTKLRPAFAPISLLPAQLRAVERNSATPYAAPREIADWRKIAQLWLWAARKS